MMLPTLLLAAMGWILAGAGGADEIINTYTRLRVERAFFLRKDFTVREELTTGEHDSNNNNSGTPNRIRLFVFFLLSN